MPLSDVRIIDCGQAIAGPLCAMYLADFGADVVKIERPGGEVYRTDRREKNGEPFDPGFERFNRNKRSLCLDMKTQGYGDAVRPGRGLSPDTVRRGRWPRNRPWTRSSSMSRDCRA